MTSLQVSPALCFTPTLLLNTFMDHKYLILKISQWQSHGCGKIHICCAYIYTSKRQICAFDAKQTTVFHSNKRNLLNEATHAILNRMN